tara:strand:- start:6068 stop:6214 length:147 start_codon:yes stop_codon:yes gene_type:complete
MKLQNNKDKKLRPRKMQGVAFPKAKYGVYIAFTLIFLILLIIYKDLIL